MKPKILLVLPYGFNDRMMNFVEFVSARLLAREGWSVSGLTRRERNEPHMHDVFGIAVRRYDTVLSGAILALRMLLFERPDIVHIHTLRNNRVGVVAALLAKLLRIPLAFSEAGLLHDHYLVDDRDDPLGKPIRYERVARRMRDGLRSYLFHYPLTHADAVAFFSMHNIPIARRLGSRNVTYLPQILDDARWENTLAHRDAAPALPRGPYGLFVGQMKRRKGWDILVRAIPHIDRSVLDSFVFVSTSAFSDDIKQLVQELGVEDRVVYLGSIPSNTGLRTVFERSRVVVVPSRYEGFGLVPLEAFETEKAVVASRVDALTDYLVDGENARLVAPGDPAALARALVDLMSDRETEERLIHGGKKTLAQFRSRESATRWLDWYASLSSRA